jgi:hypothetical protein
MMWELSYQYKCNNLALDGSFIYRADEAAKAVASAKRWINCRLLFPEFFQEFYYFQISPYEVGQINDQGQLLTRRGMRLMEWSRDRAGVDLDTYCDWKVAEYSRVKS